MRTNILLEFGRELNDHGLVSIVEDRVEFSTKGIEAGVFRGLKTFGGLLVRVELASRNLEKPR